MVFVSEQMELNAWERCCFKRLRWLRVLWQKHQRHMRLYLDTQGSEDHEDVRSCRYLGNELNNDVVAPWMMDAGLLSAQQSHLASCILPLFTLLLQPPPRIPLHRPRSPLTGRPLQR